MAMMVMVMVMVMVSDGDDDDDDEEEEEESEEEGEERRRAEPSLQNEDPTPQDGWEMMVGVIITNPGPPPSLRCSKRATWDCSGCSWNILGGHSWGCIGGALLGPDLGLSLVGASLEPSWGQKMQ